MIDQGDPGDTQDVSVVLGETPPPNAPERIDLDEIGAVFLESVIDQRVHIEIGAIVVEDQLSPGFVSQIEIAFEHGSVLDAPNFEDPTVPLLRLERIEIPLFLLHGPVDLTGWREGLSIGESLVGLLFRNGFELPHGEPEGGGVAVLGLGSQNVLTQGGIFGDSDRSLDSFRRRLGQGEVEVVAIEFDGYGVGQHVSQKRDLDLGAGLAADGTHGFEVGKANALVIAVAVPGDERRQEGQNSESMSERGQTAASLELDTPCNTDRRRWKVAELSGPESESDEDHSRLSRQILLRAVCFNASRSLVF